jgi:secreted trypsin-like serine protease
VHGRLVRAPSPGRAAAILRAAMLACACSLAFAATGAFAAGAKPRIVNGSPTPIADAPFQVALYDPELVDPKEPDDLSGAQFCGGVIRDATHVLTAAHCVTFDGPEVAAPGEIEVLAGAADLEEPEAGSVRDPVLATSYDPEWNPGSEEHDVGVLTLEKPLWTGPAPEIDGSAKIAPIAFASALPATGSEATVSGWGFDKPLLPEQEPSEEAGFPPQLQSAKVQLIGLAQCSEDYEEEGLGPFGEDFICALGSTPPITDACFGDSGGPLFTGAAGDPADRLLGLVNFGTGCAQPEFPGVYQSMLGAQNRAFASSDPPQGPRNVAPPSISGTAEVGRQVRCEPGAWLGSGIEFRYAFYRDESTVLHPFEIKALSTGPTRTIQSADAGRRIFCTVEALNAGGLGGAISDEVLVPTPAVASPPAAIVTPPALVKAAPAPVAPTLRVLSQRCGRGTCKVVVRAGKAAGQRPVGKLDAKLSFARRVRCRKHGRRATCLRRFTRKVGAQPLSGGRFSLTATGLRPGAYTLTLLAIDSAGLRQTHATKIALVLAAPRARR